MRSIWWVAISRSMSAGVPTIPRVDDALADAGRVVVDEADDAIGEVVLIEHLARDLARRVAGADKQQPLLELQRSGDAVEGQAPAENRDQEDEQRRDEDAVPDHQVGVDEVERREHDRRGPRGLQQADDQLAAGVDDGQIIEVVVVQAELADQRDEHDLPEVGGQVGRVLEQGGERDRSKDQQQLGGEHRQAARRYVSVEELHGPEPCDLSPRRNRRRSRRTPTRSPRR